jgi:hypothetical protein
MAITFGTLKGKALASRSCITMEIIIAMTYVYSAFAAMCDFTVGNLPIFVVDKLQKKMQTKMAVVGILGMACMYMTAPFPRLRRLS